MKNKENEKSLVDFFKNREVNEALNIDSHDEKQIKNAVFSTIGSAEILADIFELFTIKFIQSQTEVIDSICPDFEQDEDQLMRFLEKKYNESK